MLKKFSFDKDVYCVNCGVRTGLLTRERTIDGKCLCLNCQSALPAFYFGKFQNMSSEDFKELYSYMNKDSLELKKKFKKGQKFSHLKLDTANGILCYGQKHTEPIYLKIENVSHFYLEFFEGATEGIGSVKMELECDYPQMSIYEVLSETEIGTECYNFMDLFISAKNYNNKQQTKNEYKKFEDFREEKTFEEPKHDPELEKALNLFMFDSVSDITEESLKKQRNRLIKSFHPDLGDENDTKYAQKINDAYALLAKYVK